MNSWQDFVSQKQYLFEPRYEKTCLRGLRPGKTQTGLLSYMDKLESWNFGFSKYRYYTISVVNNKGADQTVRMRRLILTFVARIWLKQVFSWRGSFVNGIYTYCWYFLLFFYTNYSFNLSPLTIFIPGKTVSEFLSFVFHVQSDRNQDLWQTSIVVNSRGIRVVIAGEENVKWVTTWENMSSKVCNQFWLMKTLSAYMVIKYASVTPIFKIYHHLIITLLLGSIPMSVLAIQTMLNPE